MSLYPMHQHPHTIYQADPAQIQTLHAVRDKIQDAIHRHPNSYVRVQTLEGHTHEGRIVRVEHGILYLSVQHPHHHPGHRPVYNPYPSSVILPLVLYELLVIVLLST